MSETDQKMYDHFGELIEAIESGKIDEALDWLRTARAWIMRDEWPELVERREG
jgi:hypothetical protein